MRMMFKVGFVEASFMNALHEPRLSDWTVDHVANWAASATPLPLEAAELLRDNDINGQVLQSLTEGDLVGMGMQKFGWRRQLLLSREALGQAPEGGSLGGPSVGGAGFAPQVERSESLGHEVLVANVKAYCKQDEEQRARWRRFCRAHSYPQDDPAKKPTQFLREFWNHAFET